MEKFLTAAEIASLCDGKTHGNATLRRVSSPERAGGDALVFAEDAQTFRVALASGAGAILVAANTVAEISAEGTQGLAWIGVDDPRLIVVGHPRLCFTLCARELRERPATTSVHPSAIVEASARLGERVSIAAGAVIGAEVVLGDDVVIGSRAVIQHGVRLGNRVVVQAGAVLGSTGFGYVRDGRTGEYILFPQQGDLVVEDDVEVGANVTIDRGALGETRIGRGTKIDNLVHVGHNCSIGRNVVIAAQVGISGSSVVEDGAILAGQVGISDHCHIGPGVILGGQAGVYRGKLVEGPGQVFAGTPAEPLREHMRSLARVRRLK